MGSLKTIRATKGPALRGALLAESFLVTGRAESAGFARGGQQLVLLAVIALDGAEAPRQVPALEKFSITSG
jgi:hypothetical protein